MLAHAESARSNTTSHKKLIYFNMINRATVELNVIKGH